jgi:hypothetical protein
LKDFGFVCELQKEVIALIINEVLRIVKENPPVLAIERARKLGEPVFVTCKEILDHD